MTPGGDERSRDGRRRVVAVAVAVVLFVAAVAALTLGMTAAPGPEVAATGASATPVAATGPSPPAAAPAPDPTPTADGTAGRILQRARRNADGSLSVEVSEGETTSLVAAGLARSGAPAIEDLQVDLVEAVDGAAGTMVLEGQLVDQGLPIRATVDLAVFDEGIRPTVRDVRVGPLPVTGAVRDDLNAQLAARGGLIDVGLAIEELRTTEQGLVVRGRDG